MTLYQEIALYLVYYGYFYKFKPHKLDTWIDYWSLAKTRVQPSLVCRLVIIVGMVTGYHNTSVYVSPMKSQFSVYFSYISVFYNIAAVAIIYVIFPNFPLY